jgi:hypothetical protein
MYLLLLICFLKVAQTSPVVNQSLQTHSSCEFSICSEASIFSDYKEKISFLLPQQNKIWEVKRKQKSAIKSISLLGRPKSSEAELQARYLDEDYVTLLLGLTSTRLRLFDGEQRRTYHCMCMNQRKRKFSDRKEQLNFCDGFRELHLLQHFCAGNLSEVSSEQYHGGLRWDFKGIVIHWRS